MAIETISGSTRVENDSDLDEEDSGFVPVIRGEVTYQPTYVEALAGRFRRKELVIAAFQRDSDAEWSLRTRSLLIDSALNNIPIAALLVIPVTDPATGQITYSVIDGQQRISCLISFLNNEWALHSDPNLYAENLASRLPGKKFSQLHPHLQRILKERSISLAVTPADLSIVNQILTFTRMNGGGTPLTRSDLRLAVYGNHCPTVTLVRLAGIRDTDTPAAQRMVRAAEAIGVAYPWKKPQVWKAFWGNSMRATGQLPAETFLWYVVFRLVAHHPEIVDKILAAPTTKTYYDRSLASLLDAVCERFFYETKCPPLERLLPDLTHLQEQFEDFEVWLPAILTKIRKLSANAHRKVALCCAIGAIIVGDDPTTATNRFWQLLTVLLHGTEDEQQDTLSSVVRLGGRGKWPTLEAHVKALVRSFRATEK